VTEKKRTDNSTALVLFALIHIKSHNGFDSHFHTFFLIMLLDLAGTFIAVGWCLSFIRKC